MFHNTNYKYIYNQYFNLSNQQLFIFVIYSIKPCYTESKHKYFMFGGNLIFSAYDRLE